MRIKINSNIKFLFFEVLVILGLWLYFKGNLGIYKHKYINELKNRETEFKERLNVLEMEQIKKQDSIKVKTKKLKNDAIKSRTSLKKVNANIDNSIVTDVELEKFLSRFPDAPEPP